MPLLTDPAFLRRLEQLEIQAKRYLLKLRGPRWNRVQKGASLEFVDFRPYAPGDDLRHVDWNIYRRLGELVVKQFAAEARLHLLLVLDTSASMGFGEKFSAAQQVTAALAYIGLVHLDRVSIITCPGAGQQGVHSFCGKKAVHECFRYLEQLKPKARTRMATVLRNWLPRIQGQGVAMVISDFYDEEYSRGLDLLRFRHFKSLCIHLISPAERHCPPQGVLQLRDLETGQELVVVMTPSLQHEYERAFERHLLHVRSVCNHHQVTYHPILTTTSLEHAILSLLGADVR